jgi:hypothetical protein
MGLVESKNNGQPHGMFQHAMNYLATQGGEDAGYNSDSDVPLANRLFSGGKPESAEQLMKELKNYRLSKSAKAKEAVIKGLIETLKELGIEVGSSDNIDTIVKNLEKVIPNPRRGDTFSGDSEKHAVVCKKIARSINKSLKKVYGDRIGDLIDADGPAEYICGAVVDLLHSFTSGIYLEYINVYDSVRKVVQELLQAEEILKNAVDNFAKKVDDSDLDLDIGADKFFEIYQKAEKEIKVKIQTLNGLLQLNLMPSVEELELAMKSEKEGREFVNKFLQPGTNDFGDTIAYAINNMGTVTSITNTLNKSLKKLGMDMEEYLNLKSINELDKFLDKKLDAIVSDSNSDKKKKDDITNILIAIDKLKKYFGHRNKLKKMMKGGEESVSGGDAKNYKSPSEMRVDKIQKRLDAMKKSQEILYNSFTKELYTAYDGLLMAIDKLGPKLAREIPVGPHIDDIIQAFYRLSAGKDLRSLHFDKALSGISTDLKSKDTKENFIQSIKNVIKAIDDASKHSSSEHFGVLKAALNKILDVIDRFNKIAKVKFGGKEQEDLAKELKKV